MLPIEAALTLRKVKDVPMTDMIPVPYMYLPRVKGMFAPNTCDTTQLIQVPELMSCLQLDWCIRLAAETEGINIYAIYTNKHSTSTALRMTFVQRHVNLRPSSATILR